MRVSTSREFIKSAEPKQIMFTGIVEGTGRIEKITKNPGTRSAVQMAVNMGKHSAELGIGQSVALNGVCLTVTKITKTSCIFEIIDETIRKTNLGNLKEGGTVNLERSLKTGGRIEGHFVLGHVDGVGTISEIKEKPGEIQVSFEIPKKLSKYIVKKGSIAIDGISLTVTDIQGQLVSVSLIPHTMSITNFKTKKPGNKINIETDILGKYALKRN